MSWLIIYDEDRLGMAAACRQINRKHEIPDEDTERHDNRIELLDSIARRQDPAVALIDLESSTCDQQYSGHRVIETIRLNPNLYEHCRPIAFTQHARPDVIELARRHGAAALISKLTLDHLDKKETLAQFLNRQRGLHEEGQAGEFELFPQTALDTQRAQAYVEVEDDALRRVFREPPKLYAQPYFWDVISLLAEGLDLKSASAYAASDHDANPSTVNQYVEAMASSMKARYKIRRTSWQPFAQDLLSALPHRRRAPSDEHLMRSLYRLQALEGLADDPVLIAQSHLDPRARFALESVWNPYADAPRIDQALGNVADTAHRKRLEERLQLLAKDEQDRYELQAAFVRGVYNLYDTYLAGEKLREYERD